MDPRLESLANASRVLLSSNDLNPPQIFAGQAALLEVLVSCVQSEARPLHEAVLDQLATTSRSTVDHEVSDGEEPTTPAVRLLWYHAGIHTALADLAPQQPLTTPPSAASADEASASDALERLLSLLLLRGPERRRKHGVGDLAGDITYRELNAALLRSISDCNVNSDTSASVPPVPWVVRLLNQLVAVATAPVVDAAVAECNDHEGSGEDESGDEVPRAAACRLISLILEHATATPHSGVAVAVGGSLQFTEQHGDTRNTNCGQSAFSVLERALRTSFGPNTTLSMRAAHSHRNSINGGGRNSSGSNNSSTRSSDETCAAERARRRTLMVELLPALYSPSMPLSSWVVANASPDGHGSDNGHSHDAGNGDSCQGRLHDFWHRLSSAATLPLSSWAVQEVEDALGAACLLLDPHDLATPEPLSGDTVPWRHAIPGSALWTLVSRGLSLATAPLARRRALHLLRAVAELNAHNGVLPGASLDKEKVGGGGSDDTSNFVKSPPKKKGAAAVEVRNERKKNKQSNGKGHNVRLNHSNGASAGLREGKALSPEEEAAARATEWLSFCDAFDLYEHEFQPHLIAQVAPVVRRLGLSAAKHDAAICQKLLAAKAAKLAASTGAASDQSSDSSAAHTATMPTSTDAAAVSDAAAAADTSSDAAAFGAKARKGTPFWLGLLPPMSFAWVRKLVAASLRVDHPQAVKHGLLVLLRGDVLPLPPLPTPLPATPHSQPASSVKSLSAAATAAAAADKQAATSSAHQQQHVDPARAMPPRWLCSVLLQVLDDTKLYRDHTPDDEVGSAVRSFFARYLAAPGLHPVRGRASLVRRVAAALAGTPGKLESPCGGWESNTLRDEGDGDGRHSSDREGDIRSNPEARNGTEEKKDEEEEEEEEEGEGEEELDETNGPQPAMWCHFAILHALGAFSVADGTVDLPGGIGPSLLEALCNRCLGADRFGCLNLAMRGLVVQALVPLVCRGTDLTHLRTSSGGSGGGIRKEGRRGGEELDSPLLRVPAKFLSLLPRAALRCEASSMSKKQKKNRAPPTSSVVVDHSPLVPGQANLLAPWAAALVLAPENIDDKNNNDDRGDMASSSREPSSAAERAVRAALAAGGQWDVSLEGIARLIALLAFHDIELKSPAAVSDKGNSSSSSSSSSRSQTSSTHGDNFWAAALAPALNQLERAYAAPGLRPWPQTRAATSLLAVSASAAASFGSPRVLQAFRGLLFGGGEGASSGAMSSGSEGGGLRACRLLAERLHMHLGDLAEAAAGRPRTLGRVAYGGGGQEGERSMELEAAIEAEAEEAAEDALACSVALATLLRALFASPHSNGNSAALGAGNTGGDYSEGENYEDDDDSLAFPTARAVASSLVCDLALAAGAALAGLLPAQLSASQASLEKASAEVHTSATTGTARARLAALAASTLRGLLVADPRLFTDSSLWTNAAWVSSSSSSLMITPASAPISSLGDTTKVSCRSTRPRLSPSEVVAALSPSEALPFGRSPNEPSAPQVLLSLLVHCDLGPLPASRTLLASSGSGGGSNNAGAAVVTTAAAGRAWSEFGVARWGALAALALIAPLEAAGVLGGTPSFTSSDRNEAAVSATTTNDEAPGDVLVALLAAAGHEAIIAKGEAREAAAAVARACHATRPVLGALLQRPVDLAVKEPPSISAAAAAAGAGASRRAWYEAVSKAAWDAFEESGSYRPSTADAVASLLFQPAFFGDEALTGPHHQWQKKGEDNDSHGDEEKEEEGVTNLIAVALAKFEALALRGKPHVLRAAVGRCCLGWRQHPRSGGAFVDVLARLLGTKEPALRLQELPSEGGWLVEGCLLKQHGAPQGGSSSAPSSSSPSSSSASSAIGSDAANTATASEYTAKGIEGNEAGIAPSGDAEGSGQDEGETARTPLSEAWARVMVLLMFEGISHDMKLQECSQENKQIGEESAEVPVAKENGHRWNKTLLSPPYQDLAWTGALCLRLLDAMLDTATLTVNPMINTDAYGQRLRGAQALCVLAPLLASATLTISAEDDGSGGEGGGQRGEGMAGCDFISAVHDRVWLVLQQPVLHVVRFYLDLFTSQIYEASPWHSKAMPSLQSELGRSSVSAQTLGSLMLVAMHATNFHAKALVTLQTEGKKGGGEEEEAVSQESTPSASCALVDNEESLKKHRAALSALLSAVAPYVGAASAFARTLAQLLVHQVVPLLADNRQLEDGDTSTLGSLDDKKNTYNNDNDGGGAHLRLLWRYLDGNKDMVKARAKQKKLLARFEVLQECSVKTMLQHGDNFNEISPVTVVDLVAAALRELYEESFVEENLVPESSSTSKDTAPLLSSSRPLLPPQARLPPSTAAALSSPNTEKANQNVPGVNSPAEVGAGSSSEAVGGTTGATNIAENEKDVINISRIEKNSSDHSSGDNSSSDHSDNVQRKIQVWWEGLELGASDALAGRQLNGKGAPRQSGLVVCATLVDKTPNVAGLTRTCEIFGASSLVIPNLGIVQSDTFKQISVTAEGWLPLEEVRPCDLLPWLQRKKREGFTVVGLEQTAKSVPLAGLGSKALPARTVLLLGKEKEGIPVEYLREVDICVEIPQLGVVRSLNVHVSGAIAIWEFTRQQHLREAKSATATTVTAELLSSTTAFSDSETDGADNDFGRLGATSLRRRLPGLPKP